MIEIARRAAGVLLRSSPVTAALRALGGARGHRLVLVYHRLGRPAPHGCEIVPSVPTEVFRAHLQILGEIADLVTLDEILDGDMARRRPAVAVTFDDDLVSHACEALPTLRDLHVPATFFLSGRALHGTQAYWFQYLESLLCAHGEERTAALLEVSPARPGGLLEACEGNPAARARILELAAGLPSPELLPSSAIAKLASAAMTVGFHTLEHEILPTLDDVRLGEAVSRGRNDLERAAGCSVRHFAYPHGKADERVAAAVKAAGFVAAFTGHPGPVRRGDDRHRLGRWEPGPLGADDLVSKLALRLHRTAPRAASYMR